MSWRDYLEPFLEQKDGLCDVYEFGVYTGKSMLEIANILNKKEMSVRKFWGFDSFEGLPEETIEPNWQICWVKGEFDSRKHFDVKSIDECMNKVYNMMSDTKIDVELIPGFFCHSLTEELSQKLKPAIYVDIDVDIYTSSVECLDFMCKNKLIVSGTILGYDDWGGSIGWEKMMSGESRAHREVLSKYGISTILLAQIGDSYPHVQTIFKVV